MKVYLLGSRKSKGYPNAIRAVSTDDHHLHGECIPQIVQTEKLFSLEFLSCFATYQSLWIFYSITISIQHRIEITGISSYLLGWSCVGGCAFLRTTSYSLAGNSVPLHKSRRTKEMYLQLHRKALRFATEVDALSKKLPRFCHNFVKTTLSI